MLWWIVGGVVVASLLVLVAMVAMVRRRVAELERVAALARERALRAAQAGQSSAAQLQPTLAGVNQRAALLQRQLARRRAGRPDRT